MNASNAQRRRVPSRRAPASTMVEAVEPRVLFAALVVSTTADSGPGSLRAAIEEANRNDSPTPTDDTITFNFDGPPGATGVYRINVASPLDAITGNVNLDATNLPAYEENGHEPVVEINGQGAGAGAAGLRIASTDNSAASAVLGLIINGFSGPGLVISGNWNTVSRCYIGTGPSGDAAGPGNGGHGILVSGDNNLVAECVVAFNGGDGVAVTSAGVGNVLAPNDIFSNGGIAIDLGDDGPTGNDTGDVDDGSNRRQNYPVITSVTPAAPSGVNVSGTLNTTPDMVVEIVLYASPTADGEGRRVVGVLTEATSSSGNLSFTTDLPTVSAAEYITATATGYFATATESETNTSEFSPVFPSSSPLLSAVYVRGSTWSANPAFGQWLESNGHGDDLLGYRVDQLPAETAVLNTTIPWTNVNQVVLRYSFAPVGSGIPQPGQISLTGVRGNYLVTAVDPVGTDGTTFVLTLDRALGVLVGGAGTDGDRVRLAIPGGGVGAQPETVLLNSLQGDADRNNGRVNANDVGTVRSRQNRNAGEVPPAGLAPYSAFVDLDANARINANDVGTVRSRVNDFLPAVPAAPASAPAASMTREIFGSAAIL